MHHTRPRRPLTDLALTRRERVLATYRAGSELLGRAAFLALTVAAAHRLSTEQFGVFMLGTTLGWLAAVASDFGMQAHVGRAVSHQPHRASELLSAWFTLRAVTSLLALLAALGILSTSWLPAAASALVLLVLVALVTGLVEFVHYIYRALGRTDVESTLTLGLRGGSLACGLLALWWRPDVQWLAAALLVAPLASLAYSLRFARRLAATFAPSTTGSLAITGPGRAMDVWRRALASWRSHFHEFGSAVAPLGIGILLSALYFRIDAFLIERWLGIEAVGLYSAVFRIVDALRLFPAAVLAVALPTLCRATDVRVVRALSTQLTVAAALGAALLWIVAPVLVPVLYGATFEPAVAVFRILLLAFPLMTLNYALTQQLIGWNGNRAFAICCAAALLVNVTLNARLIPAWSIEGAAWATLATEAALTIGCTAALARGRRRRADGWREAGRAWQEA